MIALTHACCCWLLVDCVREAHCPALRQCGINASGCILCYPPQLLAHLPASSTTAGGAAAAPSPHWRKLPGTDVKVWLPRGGLLRSASACWLARASGKRVDRALAMPQKRYTQFVGFRGKPTAAAPCLLCLSLILISGLFTYTYLLNVHVALLLVQV